ncbi:restriction endonuclease subunit S [Amylibacter sp.]|nr:restriction endonuclease subunit S [Amylibacter sp.]
MSNFNTWEDFLTSTEIDWEITKLAELFSNRQEKGREDLPLLSVTGSLGVIDRDQLNRRDTSNSDKGKYLRVADGDIVYNTMRMWQGVSGSASKDGIVSPAYTVAMPNKYLNKNYAKYLVKNILLIQMFHKNSQGMVNDTLNLKFPNFASINVKIPPLPEQKKIASILTSVDKVIETIQKQINKLQDLKKATINELLTKGIGHTEFKDSELGRIPKSWEVKRLGDFSEFRNGLNFSKKSQGVGLKIVGVGDFKNYERPKYSNLSEINPDGVIREDDYLKENDFIFVRSNGNRNLIGRSLYIKNIGAKKVSYSGFVIRCRIDFSEEITPNFCNCIFQSSLFKKKIYDAGAGTNISNLSQELLSEIFLQFPPVEEQNKISQILNSISKRIVNWEFKLSQTQYLKKSLMQDLLTGKVRVQVH